MKSMKQKTLTMALFGLLAANASWNLINNEGSNYFAGQVIEGQSVLASVASETAVVSDKKETPAAVVKGVSLDKHTLGRFISDAREKGIDISTDADVKPGFVAINFRVTDAQKKRVKNFEKTLEALKSPEAKKTGVLSVSAVLGIDKTDGVLWGTNTSEYQTYTILVQQDVTLDKEIEVTDRLGNVVKTKISLKGKGIKTDFLNSPEQVNYEVAFEVSEGQGLDYCGDCFDPISLPISVDTLENGTAGVVAEIQKLFKTRRSAALRKSAKDKELACRGANMSEGSDEQLECLVARIDGKDYEGDSIKGAVNLSRSDKRTKAVKRDIVDQLTSILTEEYEGHEGSRNSEEFTDLLKGSSGFKKLHNKVKKSVLARVAKEAKIEENEEITELKTEALEEEISRIDQMMASYDSTNGRFESMLNYSTRAIEQMERSCGSYDSSFGTMGSRSNSRNYFNDGFSTYGGQTNTRSMTTMPGVNQMGGNNQFAQWQQQNDQLNRQIAQTNMQNCMQRVQGAKDYYNWELSSYEDNRLMPLKENLEYSLYGLDVKRIFRETYSKDKDYNGGLHKDDLQDFAAQINSFRRDFQGMGMNISSQDNRNSLLYSNTNRSRNNNTSYANNNGSRNNSMQRGRTSGQQMQRQTPNYNNNGGTTTRGRQSTRGTYLR